MTTKRKSTATVISAKVVVCVNIRQLIEDELYLKMPDAAEIVVERVDWDETAGWLDNDLERLPVAVEIRVSE